MLDASEIAHRITGFCSNLDGCPWHPESEGPVRLGETVWQVWTIYSEVYNGGLWQYFANSSGEDAPVVSEALKEIGAAETAAIVEAAISELGVDVPWKDEMGRQAAIHNLPKHIRKRLWELDGQLGKYIDNLPVQLYNYLLKHRHEIKAAPAGFWEGAYVQ
jgi:hypothetical protein